MLNKVDHCKTCLGWSWGSKGYVPASGTGENGVLIIAEAAGEHEAAEGMPLVGKSGHYFWNQLQRVGIDREGFKVHNVLSCRPPDNKLLKMAYEAEVIAHCAPLLDSTIADMHEVCRRNGRTFTILTLGKIAFKRIMGIDDKAAILKEDYLCYPHWNEKYGVWVVAADHPSYLNRGKHNLVPVMTFAVKRAMEIAQDGLRLEHPSYLLDPEPVVFQQWVDEYRGQLEKDPLETFLSYDIETPYKQGKGEDEVSDEEGDDYTILRCSFSYKAGDSVSVPWRAEYMPMIEELFGLEGPKIGWNSSGYDDVRIINQVPINGDRMDAMLAWHVLNTSLPKSLGFVTPFYAQSVGMWKHLSAIEPAYYNAADADMALRCWLGIRRDLKANDLWKVFDRHVTEVNRVFKYMGDVGVLRDETARNEAERVVGGLLVEREAQIQATIPLEARRIDHVYRNIPKSTDGLLSRLGVRQVLECSGCGLLRPRKDHFKSYKKKVNPCAGLSPREVNQSITEYYRLREWKPSKDQLLNYQKSQGHRAIWNHKEHKITFDKNAMLKLMKSYPKDTLYPQILGYRKVEKLLGTYIGVTEDGVIRGGMPVGRDGRIHTLFTHNPSTLRSASQSPNLQNLPRPTKKNDDLANLIRNLIIAGGGNIFTARDYSGIEAVLVGYFARSPRYIRLSKADIHSFYTAYALNQLDGRVKSADLPDFDWPDNRLFPHLAWIKKEFAEDRNSLYKHLVHGANFFQGANGAKEKILKETGVDYPVQLVQKVMDIYFELFPEIRKWHRTIWQQAEDDGFVRNPFGYVHRFNAVWSYEKVDGKWEKKPGPQANQVVAFLPQSTAAGIIKEAMLRLYFNHFDEVGQYLRLLVHDELFCECTEGEAEKVDAIMKVEMEKPIPELALPASYGMGSHLVILTEPKKGSPWGAMR